MKTKRKRKPRLYGKEQPRFQRPLSAKEDKGFSLRLITESEGRFAVVKQMRKRLQTLMDDAGVDTVSKEWLAARRPRPLTPDHLVEQGTDFGKPMLSDPHYSLRASGRKPGRRQLVAGIGASRIYTGLLRFFATGFPISSPSLGQVSLNLGRP